MHFDTTKVSAALWGLLLGVTIANYPIPGAPISLGTVAVPLLIIPTIALAIYPDYTVRIKRSILKAYLVYIIYICVTSATTVLVRGEGIITEQSLVTLPVLPIVTCIVCRERPESFRVALSVLHYTIVAGAVLTLVQATLYKRAYGATANPNTTAMVLVLGILISTWRLKQSKSLVRRLIEVILIITLVFNVYLTGSRSGYIAFLIVLVGISFYEGKIKALVLSLGIAAILGIYSLNIKDSYNLKRVYAIYQVLGSAESELPGSQSILARWEAMVASVKIYIKNPLLGVGVGQSRDMITKMTKVNFGAHNSYGALLSETGTIGAGIFFYFIYRILEPLRYSRTHYSKIVKNIHPLWLIIGMLAIFAFGFTARIFQEKIFWVWLSICCAHYASSPGQSN